MIEISVINESTDVSDAEAANVVAALQTQVFRDFEPAWGIEAHLSLIPKGAQTPTGTWWLSLLDNSDQAGALGYHDVTSEGLPLGKVFIKSSVSAGSPWSTTASHELLEMLADPDINLSAMVGNSLYAYEVCDSPEADAFAYHINGVMVSDFVYPSWFETFLKPGTQFDHRKHITTPLQLLPGGYIGIYNLTNGTGWQQLSNDGSPNDYLARAKIGSRRERRRIPKSQWMLSKSNIGSGSI